ncbi:MAG TPA: amidohydrolase family protein [Myxococcota bacterium]|nr:amidohydrolase family protein [Myxococcota bacterium]
MRMEDMVIASVDDHIVEPPDMFRGHLPKDVVQPHVVENERGDEVWVWDDLVSVNIGLNAVVGRPKHEWGMEPARFEHLRKASYDVDARVDDMNVNGVFASLCFGTFVKFDGRLLCDRAKKDPKNAYRVLQAYNDWHIDTWCAKHPTRFIPLANIPQWDVALIVEEVERVHAKGCNAVTFPDNPAARGLPGIHDPVWEPFWRVCAELGVVINCHIGTGYAPPYPSMESPIEAWITGMPISIANSAADWITLDAFQRYPTLKMALSEGGIGWVPYLLERADFTNRHHGAWTNKQYGGKRPSDVFREHILTCFIEDDVGLANRHRIGVDNICLEVDYPHSDCLWPDMPEGVWRSIQSVPGGIPDAEIDKITFENVLRHYRFDGLEQAGGRNKCSVHALRELGRGVDTRPVSLAGRAPIGYAPGKVVTSRDVIAQLNPTGR